MPEGIFDSGLGAALTAVGGRLAGEARRIEKGQQKDEAKAKTTQSPTQLPPEKTAQRLRHGAAVAARRAEAAAGRREMTRAALDLLSAPENKPAEATGLPAAVKNGTGAAMEARLTQARRLGFGEEDLARLEADLGAHQLLLLEQGLAEQVAQLHAQAAGQLEAEAGELVAAVRRQPTLAASAAAGLDDLIADFAPGFAPEALESIARETRAALAAAAVEGHLDAGDPEAAQAALGSARTLSAATRNRLGREIAAERDRGPAGAQALAEALDPKAEDPALHDWARMLAARPREAWAGLLAGFEDGADEQEAVLRLAEPLRRRVELDPRGAVADRVEARIAALGARGRLAGPQQEARARRVLAEAFQREAGIAAPRIFSNQERADWVQAYLRSEPEARPALLLTVPGDETSPLDPSAVAELVAGLPAAARGEAQVHAAMTAELDEAGIDPASVDLASADPESLFGLRAKRPAEAPQLAQAGGDDAGAATDPNPEPFDRQARESTLAWLQRLFESLYRSQTPEERRPIYEAFFEGLPGEPTRLLALQQGVRPDAHETAEPAPRNIQRDYQGMRARGGLSPGEILPPALAGLFFVGPDGQLYWRGGEEMDAVPWPALLKEIDFWMRHDQVQDIRARRDWPAFLQHLWQQGTLLDLQAGQRAPRRLGNTRGGGRKDPGSKPGEAKDPERTRSKRSAGPSAARLPVGRPDPVLAGKKIMQPVEDRQTLLRMAAQAKPDFDRRLEGIAKAVPGTGFEPSRVKQDSQRLAFKLKEFQDAMRKSGVEPGSPDSGAHLIRDYLAGRLVPGNDRALSKAIARVTESFEVVGEPKNYMMQPRPDTGYSAIHVQVRLENGLTAELQIVPSPFTKAAAEQREIFEKYRNFGEGIPLELIPQWNADVALSRQIFARAWQEWLAAGNKDVRNKQQ